MKYWKRTSQTAGLVRGMQLPGGAAVRAMLTQFEGLLGANRQFIDE